MRGAFEDPGALFPESPPPNLTGLALWGGTWQGIMLGEARPRGHSHMGDPASSPSGSRPLTPQRGPPICECPRGRASLLTWSSLLERFDEYHPPVIPKPKCGCLLFGQPKGRRNFRKKIHNPASMGKLHLSQAFLQYQVYIILIHMSLE
jgi:hypothetical protein